MTSWKIGALANTAIMAAYLAISIAIAGGLWRSRQWRNNPLGLATAAIFFTCAVGHGAHAAHLLLPLVGLEHESDEATPAASGDFHTVAADVVTAMVGTWYWTLRGRFPALVRGAAIFEDLRLRQAAEQRLRASEERYRGIVEATRDGVVLVDADGLIRYANAQFAVMVGRAGQDLQDIVIVDLVGPDDHMRIRSALEQVRRSGTQRLEVGLRHREGRQVYAQIALTARAGASDGHGGVLAMVSDVTEQKSIEAQLRQAQKLDAIGQLAGGVAHDFNNLLTVIDGYAAMLLARGGGAGKRELAAIREAAARATSLTSQLLVFSRTRNARPSTVDLNDLVRAMQDMLRRLIREDIDLSVVTAADSATAWVDQGQLEQVLINLAVNGRDAMPRGGLLTIETGNADFGREQAARLDAEPGTYVVLTVSDTGHGIPAEIRSRIFEPFFTTKEPGKGTGLGLSTAYGIIRQAGGHIDVDSQPGVGTSFRVCLPTATAVVVPQPQPGDVTQDHDNDTQDRLAGGSETILLVEDDPAVGELTATILRTAGFQVLVSTGAQDAITLVREHPNIDLLLTDVIMPGMNGRQLAEQLTAAMPGLPVVFASAYTRGVLSEQGDDSAVTYLDKPFTAVTLTETIRHALDSRGARSPSFGSRGQPS